MFVRRKYLFLRCGIFFRYRLFVWFVQSASRMTVLPAKAGSIMIMEYFKKDKKLESRLEKIG